ncbi:MAG: ABC transporter ATP-binding protein [Alphaproteobacteria bacterium]|nr:ABC transporter ATP-binding protein [Alphaproteobacteria bacterium]
MGAHEVAAVRDVTLTIGAGEYVAVMGPSGSGKSTFMNLVGALDVPTVGTISIAGRALNELDGDALASLRNRTIGFVFQQFNLLSRTSALGNVMLPLDYSGLTRAEAEVRARATLVRVGLGERMSHGPSELSGGQQQRVAIARAIVNEPQILLADEPTGALDSATSEEIMTLFRELNRGGITVILITHEPDVAAHARRQIRFKDGRVVSDTGGA